MVTGDYCQRMGCAAPCVRHPDVCADIRIGSCPCVGLRESTYRNCSPEAISQGLVYSLTCASLIVEVPCRRARSSG